MIHEYKDFYAFQNEMPPEKHPLRVGGTVVFSSDDYSARLEERGENSGFNTSILHLDLVVTPPGGGAADVITDFPLPELVIDEPAFRYEEVEFHLVGIDGDPPPRIPVERPTV